MDPSQGAFFQEECRPEWRDPLSFEFQISSVAIQRNARGRFEDDQPRIVDLRRTTSMIWFYRD